MKIIMLSHVENVLAHHLVPTHMFWMVQYFSSDQITFFHGHGLVRREVPPCQVILVIAQQYSGMWHSILTGSSLL